jgi:hypothetical protein
VEAAIHREASGSLGAAWPTRRRLLGAVGVAPSASVNLDGVAVILFPRGVAAADP